MKKKKNDLKYKITFIVGIILSIAAIVVISKFVNESATRKSGCCIPPNPEVSLFSLDTHNVDIKEEKQ